MSALDQLKTELADRSQRGITFIIAASIYWSLVGMSGIYFEPRTTFMISVWGTGILFPISVLIAKVYRIDIFFKNSLTPLGLWANIFQLFFFPLFFVSAKANIYFPPIFMGVLAGAHFIFYYWLYNCRTYLFMTFAIVLSSYGLGYLFLDQSYAIVGLTNAGWLALGAVGLAVENRQPALSTSTT